MTDLPNSDENWEYLSRALQGTNNDDDINEDELHASPANNAPRTSLEAQIQNLVTPNAELSNVSGLRPGKVHVHGQFRQASGRYVRRGMHVTEAIFMDSTGSVRVVWFNQPYRAAYIKQGLDYELRGTYALNRGRFQISNAKIRPLSEGCKPFERGDKG